MRFLSVLISGYAPEICDGVRTLLAGQHDLQVRVRVLPPAESNPLQHDERPDVLVVVPGPQGEALLQSLARLDAADRPPTLVIGPSEDPALMRAAIRAGARDYLVPPLSQASLIETVKQLGHEPGAVEAPAGGAVIAVINVKGGSGASFLAASLAHVLARQGRCEAGLLDLDLQFGALPLAFDLAQPSMLMEALAAAAQLDDTALRGYMSRHRSGVNVLSAMSEQLALPWQVAEDAVTRLLEVMRRSFPVVVVDLPRQIDPLTTSVLTRADRVLMVMQQSLPHVRDARRMQSLLSGTLGVARDRLTLVVNRHSDRASVSMKDVQDTVQATQLVTLPNDFQTVSEALNVGAPVCEHRPDSAIARAIAALATRLGMLAPPPATAAAAGPGLRGRWRAVLTQALGS